MAGLSKRAYLWLDILYGLTLALAATRVFELAVVGQPALAAALALVIVANVVGWVLWRRRRLGQWAPGILALSGILIMVPSQQFRSFPLFFVVLIVVTTTWGVGSGMALVIFLMALAFGLLTLSGLPILDALGEISVMSSVLIAVFLIAALIGDLDASRQANERLLADLRASVAAEKDLALAEERARAARDLHDGLGHQLTAVRMGLDYAERVRASDADTAWAEVARAREQTGAALDAMRRWVRALNPVRVGTLDPVAAFRAIADSFQGTGLSVGITVRGQERPLGDAAALYCHRFVQEGLTNAVRHAEARTVSIEVEFAERLGIALTDDGRFDKGGAEGEVTEGFGHRSLRERAEDLGGEFHAGWVPDGFRLTARLPYGEGRTEETP